MGPGFRVRWPRQERDGTLVVVSDIAARLTKALAGRYVVERELGHGGMATVHLARDVKHGRTVAIKVLRPELAQAVGSERFLREINIAAQLQSPHILPLLESGEADGLLYYVMPYVEGDSLRTRLVKQGALPPSEAMRLLRDVVDALAHAHRHQVVHRDIKPDNVMIADRHAVVMDFGVAKAMSDAKGTSGLTSIGISLGTPAYMAPEQAAADPFIDHRADIYSIGVLGYEMLAGTPPFVGTPQAVLMAQIANPPTPLLQLKPEVPPAIAQIVMKCLEKDPANRYLTADGLLQAIESLTTPAGTTPPLTEARSTRVRRRAVRVGAVLAIATVATIGIGRVRRDRWVHQTALPELNRLIVAAENDSAFDLAMRIQEAAPRDSALEALWPRFARMTVVRSTPEGATVYRAPATDTSRWFLVGTTPMDSVRLPIGVNLYRFERPGYRTAYSLFHSSQALVDIGYLPPMQMTLDSINAPFTEMTWIPGGLTRAFLVGSDGATPLTLADYRIDRFEVSNSQYKAFVDAGGYSDRQYWEHEFVGEDGRTIAFESAIAGFVDRTGRPGPGTWEAGTFPNGLGDVPVGGVSWYEAAAFARFAGKSLPTIYHWARAAAAWNSKYVVPFSNLEGSGPAPTGTPRGISIGGVSDMAGNVREWCVNDAGRHQRFILGGGWSDAKYAFVDAYAQPPMNRAAINGIRLAKYDSGDTIVALASRPIPRAFTDYTRERPVSDAVYASYRPYFDYDPIALDAKVEMRDSTAEDWIAEKVSFTAAYGGERVIAWVYLPRNGKPPYQTVVLYPGSGAIGSAPFNGVMPAILNYVAPSGRIAVYPIYKSTHERSDSLRSDLPDLSIFWRDHVVMWVKDYRRTLDYLSSRTDVDTARFAYFGFSWGGYMGGIIPAVEPRIKASMLYVAGLTMERGRPEVEPLNHLSRIKSPVLMLNGKYDFFFPSETAQKPFYNFLGTREPDKVWKLYEGGHDVPRTELIRQSLAWLDKYLGPVR
jgi:eukaryotic-like serine/threonine-protein kinase